MGTSDGFFTTLRLAELTLRVADAGRVASFYEDQLGLQRLAGRDGQVRLSANGDEPALMVLHRRREPLRGFAARPGCSMSRSCSPIARRSAESSGSSLRRTCELARRITA